MGSVKIDRNSLSFCVFDAGHQLGAGAHLEGHNLRHAVRMRRTGDDAADRKALIAELDKWAAQWTPTKIAERLAK